jgi:lysozyme
MAKKIMNAKGISVSKWTQTVDWSAVKDDGISFAFSKATEGMKYVDDLFHDNWESIKGTGLLRGAYHFFSRRRTQRNRPDFTSPRLAHWLRTTCRQF